MSRGSRLRLKCDGTRAETRFRLSGKRTSPFKSAEGSVQSTSGSRVVRISGNNAGYTMFWGSVKGSGYPLHSPVTPLLPLPCVTICHHISVGLLTLMLRRIVVFHIVFKDINECFVCYFNAMFSLVVCKLLYDYLLYKVERFELTVMKIRGYVGWMWFKMDFARKHLGVQYQI